MLGMDFDPDNVPDQLELFDHVLVGDYLATAQLIHVEEMIRKYEGPVLVVHGTGDEAVPFRYGKETAEAFKNGRLVAIKDANHGYEGHIDEMCEAVREFLLEMLEDEEDLAEAERSYDEYKKDPVTYTLEEMEDLL